MPDFQRRSAHASALSAMLLASAGNAKAADIELISPMKDVAILEPADPAPPGGASAYSPTGPSPLWNIGQWNIPGGKLPPFTSSVEGNTKVWKTHSAEAAAILSRRDDHEFVVDLRQDGSVLPCTSGASPRESDLFLGPNDRVQALQRGMTKDADRLALSDMTRLRASLDYAVRFGRSAKDNGCGVNQAAALIGIVLGTGSSAQSPQTMFYQMSFSRFCGPAPAARAKICGAPPTQQTVYFPNNPFGVDDYLPLADEPYVHNGEARKLTVDLLPRLIKSIQAGPPGVDQDISHWHVAAMYLGQIIWGSVSMQTSWKNFDLTATSK